MKRQPSLWLHVVAGIMVVSAAATWNVSYHRAQAARAEAAERRQHVARHTWREARPEERRAAIASIQKQLDAFRNDNYERAVDYQCAALQEYFVSADMFRQMIRKRYPQFADHRSVEFGRSRATGEGDRVAVRVQLTGRDGVKVRALYMMVREGEVYRVGSVIGGEATPPAR